MRVLGIDPGTTKSGWVLWDIKRMIAIGSGISEHPLILDSLKRPKLYDVAIIEKPAPMGMTLGHDLCETIIMAGRYYQAATQAGGIVDYITRVDVKKRLVGKACSNDAIVNAHLRAYLAQFHGCTERDLKGKKAAPGPCFGLASHMWPALAAVIAAHEGGVV